MRPTLVRGHEWTAAYAAIAIVAAGLVASGHYGLLVVLAVPLMLAVGPMRAAQISIAILLVQGASSPLRGSLPIDPAFLLPWIIVLWMHLIERTGARLPKVFVAGLLLYVGAIAMSTLLNAPTSVKPLVGLVNYAVVAVLVAQMTLRRRTALLAPALVALTFHIGLACYELLSNKSLFYGNWKLTQATYVGGIVRISSSVADPNYFSLTLLLLVGIVAAVSKTSAYRSRYVVTCCVGLLLIPLTFSRAGFISLGIGVIVVLLRTPIRRSAPLLVTSVAVVMLLVLALTALGSNAPAVLAERFSPRQTADASVDQRTSLQTFGLQQVKDSPWIGIGTGNFEKRSEVLLDPTKPLNVQTDVLNTYLLAALDGGLLGLLALAMLLFTPLPRLVRGRSPLAYSICGVAVGIATLDALTLSAFWVALGVVHSFRLIPEAAALRKTHNLQSSARGFTRGRTSRVRNSRSVKVGRGHEGDE